MEENYKWISKIISSCKNNFHFESADKLIELFAKKYGEENALTVGLQLSRAQLWNDVHGTLN